MRILIFHGYLLGGTGSNVYNARLAEALAGMGHEVHMLCQDRHPERQPFADAAGDWDSGELRIRSLVGAAEPGGGRCTLYRPDIGGLLPVYVLDRYEGVHAKTFADCSDAEVNAYVEANAAAVRELAERVRPDVALANHLVMGPAILARGLPESVPYAVKVHGSALEYTVKPAPERFLPYAREGLARAKTVLVGSTHTAKSLWAALGDESLPARTRLGPPGVDIHRFRPRDRDSARAAVQELAWRLRAGAKAAQSTGSDHEGKAVKVEGQASVGEPANAFARDERAVAAALERVLAGEGELVGFVGKLIAAKGVDLLLDAWPSVLAQRPHARLLVIGFGSESKRFQATALALGDSVVFCGRLDHDEVADVLPLCEALVVPSTFPEAFGMVAAEAAACGALPVCARHSGLAEVAEALAASVLGPARDWLSFPLEDGPRGIAERLLAWLGADPDLRRQTRQALVATVRERWSWEGVARDVIAAARGELQRPLTRRSARPVG